MADAINFSKTQRIVLLVDLNPLLSQNPNPNYITCILATSKVLLSFPRLSSSLFSFKLFFSSLSSLDTASTLHRLLPNHSSVSLSFNSPSQTLDSLSDTLNSISSAKLTYSPSNASHTASSLLKLAHDYDWELDIENSSGNFHPDLIDIRSNLVILLSPVCRSLKSLAEFICVEVNDPCLRNLDGYSAKLRDCFGAVNDAFNGKDIHFCWIDIHSHEEEAESNESKQHSALVGSAIRKFGWGFCSADSIVLGSALVSFGLIYPNIAISSKLPDSLKSNKKIRGQLSLAILDVNGKPIECKCCDLELLHLKSSKLRSDDIIRLPEVESSKLEALNSVNTFLGNLKDGIIKLHVTAVHKYTMCEKLEEFSSDNFLVQSVESGKREKDKLDDVFADRVLEQLASEKFESFEKHTVPTWQILLNFLYKESYWALLSISNNNGDSYTGILKPFTVHSAVLSFLHHNNVLVQRNGVSNLHGGDGKRKKMKKHTHKDLTWNAFCNAAYKFIDVDLTEVYFANGFKKCKKLKFLMCWMKEVKNKSLSLNNIPDGSCQIVPDSIQQKETDVNQDISASQQESDEQHLSMPNSSQQSRIQEDVVFESCSETSEAFFSSLPKRIKNVLESDRKDLKILAERLVNSSIYWLSQKHKNKENNDEFCAIQVAEIIKLLLTEPKDLKEHKDNNPKSTSEFLVREYELQILLRMEILQSEYAGSMKESMKTKLVKQICSLLEIVQYLVEGGFHGEISLYDYVERTIKTRYSQNLEDVVNKIYEQMDLLPFGEEHEDESLMFNSEDSNREMAANKIIHDLLSVENESSNPLDNIDPLENFDLGDAKEDNDQKLSKAHERREMARRIKGRMPDLNRVWAPKPSKTTTKVKPVCNRESKRKKQRRDGYSVVCETPMVGGEKKDERGSGSNSVYKALFQDDR